MGKARHWSEDPLVTDARAMSYEECVKDPELSLSELKDYEFFIDRNLTTRTGSAKKRKELEELLQYVKDEIKEREQDNE